MKKKVVSGSKLVNLSLAKSPEERIVNIESDWGIYGVNDTAVGVPLSTHALAMGSIGSGKTNTMLLLCENVLKKMTQDDVIIFFDPKGDYAQHFADDSNSYITGDIDPKNNNVHWNVFKEIYAFKESLREDVIRELATTIFQNYIDKSQNPSFMQGARDLFFAVLYDCVQRFNKDFRVLHNQELKKHVSQLNQAKLKEIISHYNELSWARPYVGMGDSVTTQGYMTNFNMVVQEVFSGSFARKGEFSVADFVKNKGGKKLFLKYDMSNGLTTKPLYTLLLDLAMKQALSSSGGGNVFFVLDEFPLIPRLNYIDSALNFGRSLGVKVLGAVQNISQFSVTYPGSLTPSIISGFSTIFAFRLFDKESREVLQDRYGKNLVKVNYSKTQATTGVVDEVREMDVIADWDITSLANGECIISFPTGNPIIFKSKLFAKDG